MLFHDWPDSRGGACRLIVSMVSNNQQVCTGSLNTTLFMTDYSATSVVCLLKCTHACSGTSQAPIQLTLLCS